MLRNILRRARNACFSSDSTRAARAGSTRSEAGKGSRQITSDCTFGSGWKQRGGTGHTERHRASNCMRTLRALKLL